MTVRPIYLDHHASTPVDPRVLAAMLPFFSEEFGNAASWNHAYGQAARDAVERARGQIAALLACDAEELVFTSGATEANNLALKGLLAHRPAGGHLIVSAAEHRSILDPAESLSRQGFAVTRLPVDEFGCVDPDEVRRALRPETVLVSAMSANNEVGSLNPIAAIGEICRNHNVLFHCDAVQAVGKLTLDLSRLPVDLLSLTAHKCYGPKGIGALFVRRGERRIPLRAQLDGGGHERHLRSGTLPVPLIVGFGAACEIAEREREAEQRRIAALRDRLWELLRERIPDIVLNGHPTERLAGNLNVSIPGVDGEALMTALTRIAVSSGSACTTADPEPSHVLRAMGRDDRLTRASLRFGLGRGNTESDVAAAAEHVAEVVARLRAVRR